MKSVDYFPGRRVFDFHNFSLLVLYWRFQSFLASESFGFHSFMVYFYYKIRKIQERSFPIHGISKRTIGIEVKKMCAVKKQETSQQFDDLICPIRYMLNILGGKWKLPIICMIAKESPARYSKIKRKLNGITNVMLAQSLKELEASGVVHREQYNEVPPRVEYALTEKGRSIVPALTQIAAWAAENMREETSCGVFCDRCDMAT
jgi:DNA-binding HxlR family transcriptional regulator